MHKSIFTLVYFSKGGFGHNEVYNMPVYLRNFYLKQLYDTKKQEAEATQSATKGKKPSKR
jgi:hypothetical protein